VPAELIVPTRIALAGLAGLAVGIEREWSGHASGPNARFAGVRTFLMLGLLGGIAGWLLDEGWTSVGVVLLAGVAAVAVLALVVLPLLPEGPYGPFDAVRPRSHWAIVLAFSGPNFLGYIARRAVGPERGYGLAGLLGDWCRPRPSPSPSPARVGWSRPVPPPSASGSWPRAPYCCRG